MGGIRGRTARDCFDQFTAHLNPVVQATVAKKAVLQISALEEKGKLEFTDQFIPLNTAFGPMYFSLAQSLECRYDSDKPANQRWRLSTREYWYRLQRSGNADDQALIRWEYMSPRDARYAEQRWCWRHVQLDHRISTGGGNLNFNKLHTPSGYVFIEDVLRFLIYDLKVRAVKADWHDRLMKSSDLFRGTFNQP